MGYTHGVKWTDDLIISSIYEVMNGLGLKTFPTHSEMLEFYNNSSLICAVSKHGGTSYWSNRLNIPVKDCETKFGEFFQDYCVEDIREHLNLNSINMKPRYPYDVLVENNIKVDVKAARERKRFKDAYSVGLNKDNPTCDIYIIYLVDDNNIPFKRYIIPSCCLSGTTTLTIYKSTADKYEKYVDNWDLILKYKEFYKSLE